MFVVVPNPTLTGKKNCLNVSLALTTLKGQIMQNQEFKQLNRMRFKKFLNPTHEDHISKIYQKKMLTFGNQSILYEYPTPVVTHRNINRDDYSQSDTGERRELLICRLKMGDRF